MLNMRLQAREVSFIMADSRCDGRGFGMNACSDVRADHDAVCVREQTVPNPGLCKRKRKRWEET